MIAPTFRFLNSDYKVQILLYGGETLKNVLNTFPFLYFYQIGYMLNQQRLFFKILSLDVMLTLVES